MLWNQIKTILLLGALSALVVGLGSALAPGHVGLFLGLALLMNLGAYWFSDKIVLSLQRAHEVSPHEAPGLHRMVEELSARAGIPKPRVYIVDEPNPNAFATGRNPAHGAVAVTTGILNLLDERELRGVLAHELGHIVNRDILISTIAAMMATVVTWIAHSLSWAVMFGMGRGDEDDNPAGGLLTALVAPLAATLVQLGISRSREYLADETGAQLTGEPLALAGALAKLHRGAELMPAHHVQPATASLFIVNPFAGLGSGLLKLFSTHPPMEERIARLQAMAGRLPPTPVTGRMGWSRF